MTKFVVFVFCVTFNAMAFANIQTSKLAEKLYPNSSADQAFVAKFFEIVELHKTNDPLLEGKGPSVANYSLDSIKFAFMTNETDTTVDLILFNWTLPSFSGLEINQDLTQLYGSAVHTLKNISKKKIASQGDNHDLLTNFSYVFGAGYFEAQMKLGNPDYEVPEAFKDWKPHPEYMSREHPLRKTLGTQTLTLLSPKKELFLKQAGATESTREVFETMFSQKGGFFNVIMGMMIHEMFHVKEGEDNVNRLAKKREISEDRKSLVEQLKNDEHLKSLYATYAKIVFSIGDSLSAGKINTDELLKLADLQAVIGELKSKYPNAWAFIWNYEYTEGFAEYVSAYSMIQGKVTSFSEQINLQKNDENNFAYRTGTIGGLYLAFRMNEMPFSNNEDHNSSLWEIILGGQSSLPITVNLADIVTKYQPYPFDATSEIDSVVDYLVSTVMDME